MLTKFSKEQLNEFRDLLLSKKEAAEIQIKDITEQLDTMSMNGTDESSLDDSSALIQEKEYLHNLKFRNQKHLKDIENALIRIKNETYGVCVVTGEMIDKNRLLAVPTTTKSIKGKKLEMKKK